MTAVITEKTFTLRLGENVLSEMEYVLDAKQTPWTIDMTSKEGVMLGICSRQGDDLKISLNDQAKGRPTDFDANRNGMVLVLLRHRYVQLSVINADGTGLHQVAAMPDFTRLGSPDWSRDGSKIAFDGWREFYGKDLDETHVFVINADGAGLKDLGMGCMPSWSPDDKQLTYCQYSEGRGVWVMNADGSGRRLIDGGGWGSQWSPVRNEIAYARNSDICIYDLGTGTSRTLLKKSYRQIFWGFGWSPDGKWISFLGGLDDGGRELAAVSIDGEEKGFKVLAPSSTPGIMTLQSTTSWGGTGNEVVISVQAKNDRTQRLYVLDFSSDKEPKLFPGIPADCWSIDPAWSLDGKRMAFCLRQPRRSNGSGLAPAAQPSKPDAKPAAERPKLGTTDNLMDSAFLAENARSVIVLRPAIALARPELANLAKLVEATLDILPKESPHIADFRQITVVVPGTNIPSGPREVAVSQWVEPVPATFLKQRTADRGYAVKESDGKKMYVHPQGGAILLYDERTLIEAGSEQAMGAYLGEKRGVLPKWLPAKSWESFRSDHLVIATGAAEIRENMKLLMENAPPLLTAPFLAVAPLWQDAECLAVGARLDDRLAVHAWLTAKNADSAVKARGTAEALKTLLQIAAKNARASFETAQQPNPLALALLDLADRLLESMKFQQEGSAVQLSTSVELDATRLGTLVPQVTAARDAGLRTQSVNNLKQIMLALHNYLDARKHFPPAVLYGPDGKTPHSWRVAVLPYLGRQDLYAQYQFDEPWDGPNNRKLLDKMPDVFRSPKDPPDSTNCAYFALVGPGTMFDGPSGTRAADVRDGFSNTLMLFEAKRDIPWTKPEDLPYDPDKPLPALGGYFEGIFNVAMADGSVRSLPTTAPEKVLRALITKAGGEPVKIQDALPPNRSDRDGP